MSRERKEPSGARGGGRLSHGPKVQIDRPVRGTRGPKKPPLQPMTTTLWEYPSQHYDGPVSGPVQGSAKYTGATPSWVIWQVLTRYADPGGLVVDPMCGSGTTLDVCKDLKLTGRGFDLVPTRDDIERADARELPLPTRAASVVFIDPPYSTHVDYSDDPDCIGRLDALGQDGGRGYYEAMHGVLSEAVRILKPGGTLALYVSDSFKHPSAKTGRGGGFAAIGFELYAMARHLGCEPLEHVAVVRKNRKLSRGNFHKSAETAGFMMRGFNHLLLLRAPAR